MHKNNASKRIVSLLLSFVMLFTSSYIVSALTGTKPYITLDGEAVNQITLDEYAKLRIKVEEAPENSGFCWQILDSENSVNYIDIEKTNSPKLWLTYALVGSMLDKYGKTSIRCQITNEGSVYYTEPVEVVLSYRVNDRPNITAVERKPETSKFMARKTTSDGVRDTHTIIIRYLFDNNAIAYESYGATIEEGTSFYKEVESPPVVGYKPVTRVGTEYVDADVVVLDYDSVDSDIIIDVIYEPALVDFAVHHHFQHLLDDDYSIHHDKITYGRALTGSVVGDGLALDEPGFRPLAYEKLTVAADGSTVIEIRYDRNYYLVDFDMNGGYGSEPVYTRFGSPVGVNTPIRHGYIFDGWELVSYGGETPTAEQKSRFALSEGKTIELPDANLKYRARWRTTQTTYTMVFWKENANDNGYSYWGNLKLSETSGAYVSARDLISQVSGINDEQYFTFNPERSDKDVLVEGDGSTIINVYYTRNYYSLTFKAANVTCNLPEKHTHTDECYDVICGKEEHNHSDSCSSRLVCTIYEHTEHTEDCIGCSLPEHTHGTADCNCNKAEHTHTTECWKNVGNRANPFFAPSNPKNGQIYKIGRNYYIYIKGSWYTYTATNVSSGVTVAVSCGYSEEHTHGTNCSCPLVEHTHTNACYTDALHTHTEQCYEFSCGGTIHKHVDACYRLHCGIPNHSHSTDSCNTANSRTENIFKIVYRKYEQSLEDLWPVTDVRSTGTKVYNNGERWNPDGTSDTYGAVLVHISKMPPEDFSLLLDVANDRDTYVMNYYLQVLDGDNFDKTYNGKNYVKDKTITAKYNYVTYDEDFFPIVGFNRYASDPAFSNNQIDKNGGTTVNFYYDRIKDKYLNFYNNNETVKSLTGIMYGAPLKDYNFIPDYPSTLEPNAYTFAGWYTTEQCFDGTEVNWDTLTMPADGIILYAKWAPIKHTVKVFLTATMEEQIGPTQSVDHKAFAHAPSDSVTNGNLVFLGWFYKDIENGKEVEKGFVFSGIPVTDDMNIYAKWDSHIPVDYEIHYVLKKTGEKIADSTYGSAILGHNKTFDAKAGSELYAEYQTGYYPLVNSHTITMGTDTVHKFTFEYVYVEAVPYKVRYVYTNPETGQEEEFFSKIVKDNKLSVVTETFISKDGMMPDAYQKRLVLSASGKDEDGDNVLDNNVITFYYNSDSVHAYYRVVHYIENIEGNDYREYMSEETVGNIEQEYKVSALTLTGFTFAGSETKINNINTPTEGNEVSAILGKEGMLIELFYKRNEYNYTARYLLNSADGEEIYPSYTGRGKFGEQIVEYAVDLSDLGYKLVGDTSAKALTLSANEEYNVFDFIYQEDYASIKYEIVGPEGCGTLLGQSSENIKAISGEPQGSQPIVNKGFKFVGWFTDSFCTIPVLDSELNSETNMLTPQKRGTIWTDTTYYAKFIALETDLTIETVNSQSVDQNQAYIFRIVGKKDTDTQNVDVTVSIIGNDSVTIEKLPTGEYTITELTGWSWRYSCADSKRDIMLEYNENGSTLTFSQERKNPYWLDGNAVKDNVF